MDPGPLPPLRVLIVEDSADDAELLLHALSAGYAVTSERVETAAEMTRALREAEWDVVISDYSLPTFSGPEALQLLKDVGQDLPFIIISGTIGEETAVSALKAGAHDFLVKGRLARLLPAIERELGDVRQRRERHRAEQALRASEAKHRALIERAVFGIFQATADGRFLTVNPALVSMLGYDSPDDLAAVDLPSLCADEPTRTSCMAHLHEPSKLLGWEGQWRRRDGQPVRVRLSGRAIEIPGAPGQVLEVIVEDTTERFHLEAQLRQAQKMEAIGHLAGGIAHDFNNYLTAILGYGELVVEGVRDRPEVAAEVHQMLHAGECARGLTAQLLTFSRKQVTAPRLLDLNAVITDVTQLLAHVAGKTIELETRLEPALGQIKADPSQIKQILLNLAVNARDAMQEGGRLTLTTANAAAADVGPAGGDAAAAAGYVVLTVSDTGCGMPAEMFQHIFEPFFTTKGPDNGTGLGLSTVYGIVTQSGGHITVESEVGRGTTFRVALPAAVEVASAASIAGRAPAAAPSTVTILLVEDDPAIRALAQRVLERCGYVVLTGRDAASGQAAAEQHAGAIDLLITDLRMPGRSGANLARQLASQRPGLKILYISGHVEHPEDLVHGHAQSAILQKPFSPAQLAGTVQECLSAG